MQRRQLCLWGGSAWCTASASAPSPWVLRVARLAVPGQSRRPHSPEAPDIPDTPDLGQDLCSAVAQWDPGLRFALAPMALSEPEIVRELTHHRLDLHWDLVATPRRREHLAFLDGPPLWRHRLQLASRAQDPDNVPNLDALRAGATHHSVAAAQDSVAAEFLAAVPGLRWSPLQTEETPEHLLRSDARWAVLPSHVRTRARVDRGTRLPPSWRWQTLVLRDEPVHGAVSLALPAPVRARLVQALWHLAQSGLLDALRARHARA